MSTTGKEKAMSMIPTGAEALEGVKDLGMLALGMIGAHAVTAVTKKDTALVNGGIALVGLGVAIKAHNPLIKMFGLGVSAFGTIKVINGLVKEVATPQTTEGLNGILPESAKALIRKFIPTLSGADDMQGAYDNLNGDDDMRGADDLSLDDESMRGDDDMRGTDEMQGIGSAKLAY